MATPVYRRGCFNLDLIETEPLHLAAKSGDTNKVESLLRDEVECVNKKNELGFTPLHVAVKYNRESIVRLLVNSGACPNIASPQVGWTPLHIATVNFNSKLVKFLLDRKANPLVKTKFGVTALDIAVAFKFTVVIFLITKITVCVNRLIVSAVLKAGETGWLIRTATVI
uniref:Ankyrin-3-like n=1 Tax=Saccoglossus kowalevskii TaxID=10224 RepID=A0ABM0M4D2_SACKO|nr:PREDICTED: ankyrin-3-like [Saccoglossus kowalevskii]